MVFCYTTHKWPKKVFAHCLTLQSFQRQSKWHLHINYISHFLGTNFTESSQPKSIQILVVFILNNISDFFVRCLVWKVYLCCLSLHKWFLVCQCQTVPSTSWDRSIWLWCLWMYLQGKICWVFSWKSLFGHIMFLMQPAQQVITTFLLFNKHRADLLLPKLKARIKINLFYNDVGKTTKNHQKFPVLSCPLIISDSSKYGQ